MDSELWLRQVKIRIHFSSNLNFYFSFWLYQILNFFIFITTAYFLLLHLRSEILFWNQKCSFSKALEQLDQYSSTFKKSDGLISRSLRLVRDITVIANGHVTVNSRKSIKAHVSIFWKSHKCFIQLYTRYLGWSNKVERRNFRIYFVLDSHRGR